MSKYTFIYEPKTPGYADVVVQFDDTEYPHISSVLNAFRQFLKGVTFSDGTIAAYLDAPKIEEKLTRAGL